MVEWTCSAWSQQWAVPFICSTFYPLNANTRANLQTINKAQLQFAITTRSKSYLCCSSSSSFQITKDKCINYVAQHWFEHSQFVVVVVVICIGLSRAAAFYLLPLYWIGPIEITNANGQSQIETRQSCVIIFINAWYSMWKIHWMNASVCFVCIQWDEYDSLNDISGLCYSQMRWTNVMQLERAQNEYKHTHTFMLCAQFCLLISFKSI